MLAALPPAAPAPTPACEDITDRATRTAGRPTAPGIALRNGMQWADGPGARRPQSDRPPASSTRMTDRNPRNGAGLSAGPNVPSAA